MKKKPLILLGSGGHAKACIDIVESDSRFYIYGIIDNSKKSKLLGYPIIGRDKDLKKYFNSEFYLVLYPWAETLEDGEKEFNWSNFGKKLCLNNKCKLIDTIPHFKKYKEKNNNWVNELYFVNDEHFNKGGAKFIANLVKNKIIN